MSAVNLITNPSFEANTTDWSVTNGTFTQDGLPNAIAGTGYYSGKCVATSSSPLSVKISVSGLTIGQNYTVAFYVKAQPTSAPFSLLASISDQFLDLGVPSASFERKFFGFRATNESDSLTLSLDSNVSGDTFWLDNVMLNAGRKLPYFDGSYPYSSWSGTANNSTSTNSVLDGASCTTPEAVIVNGTCVTTHAIMIENKNGRYTLPVTRGDDLTLPGINGKTFVSNKPIDSSLWTLNLLVLGCNPDGSIPSDTRMAFENNMAQFLSSSISDTELVPVYAWQPDGTVRTANVTALSTSAVDPSLVMGGRRAEIAMAYTVMQGYWSESLVQTISGTPGASWNNQYLTLSGLQGGIVPIEDAVITVNGPVTNPRVQNDTTGTWVQYTGTVPSGQSWVVDCGQWTSKVNNVSVLSKTTHFGHPRFVLIDPGSLTTPPNLFLTGTGTGSTTNLSVTASRKFWTA